MPAKIMFSDWTCLATRSILVFLLFFYLLFQQVEERFIFCVIKHSEGNIGRPVTELLGDNREEEEEGEKTSPGDKKCRNTTRQ